MVREYKRKTDRGSWPEESMLKAIQAVLDGKMGYYKAAKQFDVPQTTLERKVKAARTVVVNENSPIQIKVPLGPRQPVFSASEENELVEYLLDMEERLYGFTINDLQKFVYKLAIRNNKPNPINDEKKEAGREWINGFLKRHPKVSIRKPESTSAARPSSFNKPAVEKFFNFLGNVYDEHQLTPDRIYNCDETGISVVPKTNSRIIAKRGRKQVGVISSAERGQTVTVEICFSAAGNYMPPMLIFPRKRMKPELMVNSQAAVRKQKETTKNQNNKTKKNSRSVKTAKRRKVSASSEEIEEEEDTPCMYCQEVYSVSIEGWISCSACGKLAHNSCAGIDDDDDEATHICEFCQEL